jgi:hypothetical protein
MLEPKPSGDKLNVFISYSRDDLDFADQLDEALQVTGFATTIDRHGISGGEDWRARLGGLIRDADTVVFILSPASAKWTICINAFFVWAITATQNRVHTRRATGGAGFHRKG